ncbi:MAG: glycosyltransferase [Bacteroidetes bacterium]|nr:MAG: glycosyltransferase [Bacteroidota bacterium]
MASNTHKGPRALVSVTNDLATDQRVHKVCEFLQKRGYQVKLVGRKLPNSLELDRTYETRRFKLWFNKGALFYVNYSFRLFFYLFREKPDLMLSNDLDTLLPNYLYYRMSRKAKRLVYDSHEYFTEVPELEGRRFVRSVWLGIEKWIVPKLELAYTVNQSIADCYQGKYKTKFIVIRNISKTWKKPEGMPSRADLGIPEADFTLIFQGAGINVDRGAEEAVEAMKELPQCQLIFVGDGDAIPSLKRRVEEASLKNVLFFPKRPYDELMQFTYHADMGLSLDKGSNLNYAYSLPNKVFDYMHASTPLLVSPMKEVRHFVESHGLGDVLPEVSPAAIVQAIREILKEPKRLEQWKANCKLAAAELSWEKEEEKLALIYPKVND